MPSSAQSPLLPRGRRASVPKEVPMVKWVGCGGRASQGLGILNIPTKKCKPIQAGLPCGGAGAAKDTTGGGPAGRANGAAGAGAAGDSAAGGGSPR